MLSSFVVVPLLSALLFVIAGNGGRSRLLFWLPAYSVVGLLALDPTALVSLLLLMLPAFAVRELIPHDRSWLPIAVLVAGFVAWFALLKDYFDIATALFGTLLPEPLLHLLNAVGLSFVVFRVIEYVLIAHPALQDISTLERFWRFLGFCLALPTVTSGPILRWRGFARDLSNDSPIFANSAELTETCQRLANGMLIVTVVSQPLLIGVELANQEFSQRNFSSGLGLLMGLLAAIAYLHILYINFAAFSSMMISSGRFLGLTVPENFNAPFSTYGFLDFFNHWHISVSQWFRDFVFTPLTKRLILRGWKSNIMISVLAFMLTFGLLGLWHGRTWPFLVCGAMLGLGAVANQLYRDNAKRMLKVHTDTPHLGSWLISHWLRGFTFTYIALAIMGLWLDSAALARFWTTAATPVFLIWLILVPAAYAAMLGGIEWLADRLGITRSRLAGWANAGGLGTVAAKIAIAWAFFLALNLEGGGQFVYEGF